MQNGLLDLHNFMRWLMLIFLIVCIIIGIKGMMSEKKFSEGEKKTALFLMIVTDIQLLLGLALYFMNGWFDIVKSGSMQMSDKYQRFWGIEHAAGMIIAIILIHLAYASVKKRISDKSKYKRLFWFTFIALVLILVTIPWPFREVIGRPWLPDLSM